MKKQCIYRLTNRASGTEWGNPVLDMLQME